jgi:hypothetical protein
MKLSFRASWNSISNTPPKKGYVNVIYATSTNQHAFLVAVVDPGGHSAGYRGVVFFEAQTPPLDRAQHLSLAQVDRGPARKHDLAAA